ncbi:MAG: alpha/beta hydrolase family protein [Pseudomonadota bacterium]
MTGVCFRNLYEDPVVIDKEFPPDYIDVSIDSRGSRMFGVFYIAEGRGPHPTIILLHGFPGTERNLDLAHAFRRAGWNVLVYHYRGSWGSEGAFSFGNVLEDVKAALKYVRSDEIVQRCRVDREKIALVGHSMGGFAALLTTAADMDIKACVAMAPFDFGAMAGLAKDNGEIMDFLRDMFKDCIVPLKGTSVEALLSEAMANSEKWSFVSNAEALSKCRLLLIAAAGDKLSLPKLHFYPLQEKLRSYDNARFENRMLDSDHSFQDKRIQLAETIAGWLENQL